MSQQAARRIEEPLRRFVTDTHARFAVLLHPTGLVLGQYGFTNAVDVMAAAALSAAIHASARELARQLNWREIREVFHPGADRRIFLGGVATTHDPLVLLTVFDNESSLGEVRMYCRELRRALLVMAPLAGENAPILEGDFESQLHASLGLLFGRPAMPGSVTSYPPA